MPKIPASLTDKFSSTKSAASSKISSSKLTDKMAPTLAKMRKVDPKAAKGSATRGAASAKEVLTLSVDYLKQETKGPLAGLPRFISFGIAGALFLGFGMVMLGLAVLRGIQSGLAYVRTDDGDLERGPLSGSLTWVPYLITAVICLAAIGLIVTGWKRSTRVGGKS